LRTAIHEYRSRQIPWKALIEADVPTTHNADCKVCDPQPEPSPTGRIGLYEGAYHYHCGVYRPAFHCMMHSTTDPFCRVCAERTARDLRAHLH